MASFGLIDIILVTFKIEIVAWEISLRPNFFADLLKSISVFGLETLLSREWW